MKENSSSKPFVLSIVLSIAVVAAISWPTPASAEDKPSAQDKASSDSPEYRKLVADGLEEFDRGNWEEATALFQQAHSINPNARTLRALGLCAFEARRYTESLKFLRAALDDKRRPLNPQQRAEIERAIDRAMHFVGRLRLELEPPDARVRIDGQTVDTSTQEPLIVNSGLLEIEISAPDHQTELRRVRMASQGEETLTVKLAPTQSAAEAPAAESTASTAEATPTPPAQRDTQGSPFSTWKWVAGGAAVAGLAVGVTFLVLGDADAADWNKCRDADDPKCLDKREGSKDKTTIAAIGFAAGGAFAVLTTVLFVLDAQHADTATTATNACMPGPGDLGLACRIAF